MLIRKTVVALAVLSVFACAEKRPEQNSTDEDVAARHRTTTPAATAPGTLQTSATSTANGTIITPSIVMMPMPIVPPLTPPVVGGTPITGTPITGSPITGTPVAPVTPSTENSFQYLPVLNDADGNPNDNNATYNLSAESNVQVNVATPAGSWITPMMRFNGLQLPPVIKVKRGTNVTVNVQNNLTENTTVHWHGFKIPAVQDGGPDSPIPAGASHTYNFQIAQAAAPLWFHPHAHGTTATQVYNGLAGAFVVTDDITEGLEASKSIPSGIYDIPLLIQDRSFAADNGTGIRTLVYNAGMMSGMAGMLGDTVLVNGVQLPTLDVETRQYRLRLFNGSNARTYDFALNNNAPFNVIGTDGGLLPSPVSTDHIVLAAGERAEIVVDLRGRSVNDSIALIDRAQTNLEIMRLNVTTSATDDVTLYTTLPDNADVYNRLTAADATNSRNFVMSMGGMMAPGGMGFLINGKRFDINRVDELVSIGATEIWNISNTSNVAHPFHAHAIQWQILDRNNTPSSGIDLGWKDTVLVQPGETVRFIGRFDPVINRGLYMYHCHILEHEDAGMMGTFQIN